MKVIKGLGESLKSLGFRKGVPEGNSFSVVTPSPAPSWKRPKVCSDTAFEKYKKC